MRFIKGLVTFLVCVAVLSVAAVGAVWYVVDQKLNNIEKIDDATLDLIAPEDEYFETDGETEAAEDGTSDLLNPEDTEFLPETDAATELAPEDVTFDTVEKIEAEELVNILLVGQDRRDGEGRQRSDSMIMCSINVTTGEVSLISFLRDMYVQIPGGYSDNRLNTAYLFGGFGLLNETLLTNFGISADYNIEVDFDGFIEIVDVIGGIDMTLTKKEAEIVGGGAVKGENRLNGEQALTFARIRKIDSDFGRTNRQRKVLMAIFEEVKSLPATEIWALIDEITPLITTDMTNGEILSLALKLVPKLSTVKIEQHTVPEEGMYYDAVIRKMMVLVPDTAKIRQVIAEEYLPIN